MYADGTVLYNSDMRLLQSDLLNVVSWCNNNVVTINTAKSKWITLDPGKSRPLNKNNLYINNEKLEKVTFNYLGLKIDEKLNFGIHRATVINSATFRVRQLAKIRPLLTEGAALAN